MTIPYNVSPLQAIKYLQETFEYDSVYTALKNKGITENDFNKPDNKKSIWFKNKDDHNIKLESVDFINIGKGLDYILYSLFPYLQNLTKYLKDIANICCELGIPIP